MVIWKISKIKDWLYLSFRTARWTSWWKSSPSSRPRLLSLRKCKRHRLRRAPWRSRPQTRCFDWLKCGWKSTKYKNEETILACYSTSCPKKIYIVWASWNWSWFNLGSWDACRATCPSGNCKCCWQAACARSTSCTAWPGSGYWGDTSGVACGDTD